MASISTALDSPRCREMRALLEQRAKPKLLRHVLGVADTMLWVASREGLQQDACAEAALLHDICKPFPAHEQLRLAENNGLPIGETAHAEPMLLHGPNAAEEGQHKWSIGEDVYQAVYWHTTGTSEWNAIGLALYFADFSEPNRQHPEAAQARDTYEAQGFFPALRYAVSAKLQYIQQKTHVNPQTQAFHDWLMAFDA